MHETSLAKKLLDVVVAHAAGARRVLRVRGHIAEDEALSKEALTLHFVAHARGTIAEGASLDLELVHVRARCRGCGAVFAPEHHVRVCPSCDGVDADLLSEVGVRLAEIDVEP